MFVHVCVFLILLESIRLFIFIFLQTPKSGFNTYQNWYLQFTSINIAVRINSLHVHQQTLASLFFSEKCMGNEIMKVTAESNITNTSYHSILHIISI